MNNALNCAKAALKYAPAINIFEPLNSNIVKQRPKSAGRTERASRTTAPGPKRRNPDPCPPAAFVGASFRPRAVTDRRPLYPPPAGPFPPPPELPRAPDNESLMKILCRAGERAA